MYLCKDIERDAYTKEQSLVIDKGDVDGGYKRVIIHKALDEVSKGLCSQGTTFNGSCRLMCVSKNLVRSSYKNVHTLLWLGLHKDLRTKIYRAKTSSTLLLIV